MALRERRPMIAAMNDKVANKEFVRYVADHTPNSSEIKVPHTIFTARALPRPEVDAWRLVDPYHTDAARRACDGIPKRLPDSFAFKAAHLSGSYRVVNLSDQGIFPTCRSRANRCRGAIC